MSTIPAAAVSPAEYVATIRRLIPMFTRELGCEAPLPPENHHEALVRARAAWALATVARHAAPADAGAGNIPELAWTYLDQALAWYEARDYLQPALDFTALALYQLHRTAGEAMPPELHGRAVQLIGRCADTCLYRGAYINHNLNTALVCAHHHLLTGDATYHRRCVAKTRSSLFYLDRFDGRNPEIGSNYGIYGIALLAELALTCRAHDPEFAAALLPYVQRSAETLPTYYFHHETGELLAATSREPVKIVMYASVPGLVDGFELVAAALGDGRYRSLARFAFDYWQRALWREEGIVPFPRWERNDSLAPFYLRELRLASRAGFASIFSASAFCRALAAAYPAASGAACSPTRPPAHPFEPQPPAPFPIPDKVIGRQFFYRRTGGASGDAVGVISNVLYSPVAYLCKSGAGLVGEVLEGGPPDVVRALSPTLQTVTLANDYEDCVHTHTDTPELVAASIYSRTRQVYSTAFFHHECLLWVVTAHTPIPDLWYNLFVYYATGEPLWCGTGAPDDVRSVPAGTALDGLPWVLLPGSPGAAADWPAAVAAATQRGAGSRPEGALPARHGAAAEALALAVLGPRTTTLATQPGGVTVRYTAAGEPPPPRSSVLLGRPWREGPEAFAASLRRWQVLAVRGGWQVSAPDEAIYLVEHHQGQPFAARLA